MTKINYRGFECVVTEDDSEQQLPVSHTISRNATVYRRHTYRELNRAIDLNEIMDTIDGIK